jgi:hypothetical protein
MKKSRIAREEADERAVLAHTDHVRSIGAALTRAADVFMTQHRASELEGDWRDDLGRNVAEAIKQFHNDISDASIRAHDIESGRITVKSEEPLSSE